MQNQNNNSIGALWLKESGTGKYMSGVIEINGQKINIVVFRNDYKKLPKHPDYRILKSEPKNQQWAPQQNQQQNQQQRTQQNQQYPQQQNQQPNTNTIQFQDDIPF
jgi:single-stranded DNA-binding protein